MGQRMRHDCVFFRHGLGTSVLSKTLRKDLSFLDAVLARVCVIIVVAVSSPSVPQTGTETNPSVPNVVSHIGTWMGGCLLASPDHRWVWVLVPTTTKR